MRIIPLTRGIVAWVDDDIFETLGKLKWQAINPGRKSKRWYAVHTVYKPDRKHVTLFMHREIMGAVKGQDVDHRVHDPEPGVIDNRRSNLRLCTRQQNSGNQRLREGRTSCFKGVSYDAARQKWFGSINAVTTKQVRKRFATELEAALWYDEQALIAYGEFALTNFSGPNAIYASLPLSPNLENSPEPW